MIFRLYFDWASLYPTLLYCCLVLFWRWSVNSYHDGVVSLVGLQRHLLLGLHLLGLHFLNFSGKNSLCFCRWVDAVSLDRDDEVTAVLQEIGSVDCHNTGLIRLSHVCEDCVDHGNKHPVLVRVPGVLNDRHNVCPLLGHVYQVTTTSVRELDCVDHAIRSDDV